MVDDLAQFIDGCERPCDHAATRLFAVVGLAAVSGFFSGVFRIFRAPPGCPGVERQFSEPSVTKSSLLSRVPAQLDRCRLWTCAPLSVNVLFQLFEEEEPGGSRPTLSG